MNNPTNTPTRILLVDDEPILLKSLARALEAHDFEITTTTCAAEAKVLMSRAEFDVIVCDQNMPGKSGLEFLSELNGRQPRPILLMLSGQISGLAIAENWAKEIGVSEVFQKPCDANFIADRIRQFVAAC